MARHHQPVANRVEFLMRRLFPEYSVLRRTTAESMGEIIASVAVAGDDPSQSISCGPDTPRNSRVRSG